MFGSPRIAGTRHPPSALATPHTHTHARTPLLSVTSNAQLPRRRALAQARNYLLSRALDDEDYVVWIDVDVQSYPQDLLQVMLATNK